MKKLGPLGPFELTTLHGPYVLRGARLRQPAQPAATRAMVLHPMVLRPMVHPLASLELAALLASRRAMPPPCRVGLGRLLPLLLSW